MLTLNKIQAMQCAVIKEIIDHDNLKQRLNDLGLCEGSVIKCLGYSPLGDPHAYLIGGAVIALRNSDCNYVKVNLCNEEDIYER